MGSYAYYRNSLLTTEHFGIQMTDLNFSDSSPISLHTILLYFILFMIYRDFSVKSKLIISLLQTVRFQCFKTRVFVKMSPSFID